MLGLRRAVSRVSLRSFSSVAAPSPSFASMLEPPVRARRDFIGAFPEETEANNFEVNWSLGDDDITPRNNCYRNRALDRLAQAASANPISSVRANATAQALDAAPFLDLWEDVTEYLGHVQDLYISDGAVGGHAAARTPIRVVSDSPALAHALANLLVKVPTLKDPHTPRPILVVWESNAEKPVFAYNIDTNEDGFTQAKLVVRGAIELKDLISTVLNLKAELDGDADTAVVAADVVVDKDGSTSLLFRATDAFRSAHQGDLAAAHGAVWHPSVGVTPAFQGAILPSGAVVAKKAKKARHQTYPAVWSKEHSVVTFPFTTVVNHPSTAVAIDASNKGEVSIDEFVQLVKGSPALAKALEQHQTKCVIKKAL
ncbi:hypothetical protein AeMF1_003460 [Aphanomyces euteiches]|nr:hypothetical protein AeMF1_003460 [Aphanomyces euteiches]KAH9192318.1 hypothetical protein AeNC1_005703 [Aphanomyces euteiches]